ncbi:MAG: TonB-dependent receptor [Tannerellaceae bacterium]|jgi:TonB-linked SusC/RagA family outer membrane protein|nr:TonB-dependent receptor [Tannerellaceae bacterium]
MKNITEINRKKINYIKLLCLFAFLFSFSSLSANIIIPEKTEEIQVLVAQGKTIGEIVSYIEKNSNYVFIYEASVDLDRKVEANTADKSVDEILKEFFSSNGLSYVIKGRQVIVKNEKDGNRDSTSPVPVIAQDELVVRGIVTDISGLPLIGVNIVVKGTTVGTVTDTNGRFELTKAPKGAILQFSYIGYKNQETAAKEKMEITLTEDRELLEEVVVVGYSTQKKVNLTGSVSTVNFDILQNRPITQASQALSGIAAGVTVSQSSSRPDADGASIRIRGLGTFSGAGSSPLVLIDGMDASLNDIDPNNIKTISVLKDAASASIYGTRAANGVILVETKRGQQGKLQISYDNYFGWQKVTELPEFVDSWEYAALRNEANRNRGGGNTYTDEQIELFRNGSDTDNYPNVPHLKNLLTSGSGFQAYHNLSFMGGREKTQYMFSLGYLHQDGVVRKNYYNRYNFQLNLDSQLLSNLKLHTNLGGYTSDRYEPRHGDGSMTNMINFAVREGPHFAGKKSDGTYGYQDNYSPEAWLDSESFMQYRKNQFLGSAELEWEIMPGLSVSGKAGYKHYNRSEKNYLSTVIFDEYKTYGPNKLWIDNEFVNLLQLQTLAAYNKIFGNHSLAVLGGVSQEEYRQEWYKAYRQNFPNNSLYELDAGSQDGMSNEGSAQEYGLRSFFGRINYAYKERYLAEVNARYDGTSRFPEGNRWGLFPSVSLGWRISEESFVKDNAEWIDNLKLRTSWGQLGNQNIGYYPYQSVLSNQNYSFGGTVASGLAVTNYVNKNISWETTTITDVGIDFSFMKGLWDITVDCFIKKTSDILYSVASSAVLGLSTSESNSADVSNKGIELAFSYRPRTGKVNLGISPNFSYVKNEVTNLGGGITADYSNGLFVGQPINAIYGYVADGLFTDQADIAGYATQPYNAEPGFIRYKDLNGDGATDAANDRKVLGSTTPEFTYGLTLTADYKGFDAMIILQGLGGHKQRLGSYQGYAFYNSGQIQRWQADNRWTEENPDRQAIYPKLTSLNDSAGTIMTSTYWLRNASFLRAKNMQIGYSLPPKTLEKIKLSQLRIFFSGQNMFCINSSYPGWDPEISSGNFYPITATYTFGLNLKF